MATTATNPTKTTASWILDAWKDLLLFIATPALIIPLVFGLRTQLTDETISALVVALGATGHHLPGMMRAYGDRDLFRRFKVRFIAAPIALLVVCVFLSATDFASMRVILLLWGFWHGLMQVYGFIRIYDAKAKSFAPITAKLDWLMCFMWFGWGLVQSSGRMTNLLETFYQAGGPLIPANFVHLFRSGWGAVTVALTIAFLINHFLLIRKGTPASNIKLFLMGSSFAFWWYAMVWIESSLLGIALFEIFHDVQYLAIVWIFNRRRVDQSRDVGAFTKFLFRRNMFLIVLYVLLVAMYGASSMMGTMFEKNSFLFHALHGFVWMSTLLHFYFDGFIWKVRESSTRDGLGVKDETGVNERSEFSVGLMHLLKWTPFAIGVVGLSFSQWWGAATRVPADDLNQYQNIVEIAPERKQNHYNLATMQQQVGLSEEAKQTLKSLLERVPNYAEAHRLLASVLETQGFRDEAIQSYERAVDIDPTIRDAVARIEALKAGAPTIPFDSPR